MCPYSERQKDRSSAIIFSKHTRTPVQAVQHFISYTYKREKKCSLHYCTFNRDAQATDLMPYVLKGKVTLKNVTVKGRQPFHLSANPGIFKDYVVEGVTLK